MIEQKKILRLPHPAIVYLALTVLVILVSWIVSIYQIRDVVNNDQFVMHSLLSAQGIRWLVRSAALSISDAPVGNALLIFISMGVITRSGMWKSLVRWRFSPKKRNAMILAAVVLLLYICLIAFGLFGGSRLLLGITGTLVYSPLLNGVVFLVTLAVLFPSITYGLATETFRTVDDCIMACSGCIAEYAQFFVTMLCASQFLTAVNYSHLDLLLNITPRTMQVVSFVIYWFPLPIIIFRHQKSVR